MSDSDLGDILDDILAEMDKVKGEILDKDTARALKKSVDAGLTCKKCGELYPYAESNQKDGSLVCYACRMFG